MKVRACSIVAILLGGATGAQAQPAPENPPPASPDPTLRSPVGAAPDGAAPDGAAPDGPAPTDAPPASPPPAPPTAAPGGAPPRATPAAPPHPAPPPYYPYYPYYPYPPPRAAKPPRVVPHEEGIPGPYGYRLRERVNRGLVIGGSVTLGSTWLLSAVVGGIAQSNESDEDSFIPLLVPLVGPFITVGTADPNTLGTFVLVVDGVAQVASLGMLIAGILYPKHEWVLPYASLELAPLAGPDALGIAAQGAF